LLTQFRERRGVRGRQCAYDEIDALQRREHVKPYDFPQASFHPIAIHCGIRIPWNDDPRAGVTQKGSDVPNLEVRGSESLPFLANCLQFSFPRQPAGARKAAAIRRRRTSMAV
jgi:hypothetical protein